MIPSYSKDSRERSILATCIISHYDHTFVNQEMILVNISLYDRFAHFVLDFTGQNKEACNHCSSRKMCSLLLSFGYSFILLHSMLACISL